MFVPTQFSQAAWVVPDLEAAIMRWVEISRVGPFFVNQDVRLDQARYRGFMLDYLNHQPAIDQFFARIAAAAVDWDGRDPVRDLS